MKLSSEAKVDEGCHVGDEYPHLKHRRRIDNIHGQA
jgi:hypothetical protein